MTYRILLPFDGTEAGSWVLTRIRTVLSNPNVEATLYHAHDPREETVNGRVEAAMAREVEALRSAGIEATGLRSEGIPSVRVSAEAAEGEYDLIVLASHSRPGSDVELFGRVARTLIQTSTVPLLILRPFFRPDGSLSPASPRTAIDLRTILVPLDGSRTAERVLPSALRLARVCGLKVYLFSTQETGAPEASSLLPPIPESLEAWRDLGESKGLDVRVCHRPGAGPDELFRTLDRRGIDLVALTTQERGRVANPTYDVLAGGVLTRSCLPVLVWRNLAHLEVGVRGPALQPRLRLTGRSS